MSTSKITKHKHTKVHSKKHKDTCPSTHNWKVPNVKHKDFQLIGSEDKLLSFMDDSGKARENLNNCAVCRMKKTTDTNIQGYSCSRFGRTK